MAVGFYFATVWRKRHDVANLLQANLGTIKLGAAHIEIYLISQYFPKGHVLMLIAMLRNSVHRTFQSNNDTDIIQLQPQDAFLKPR